MIILFFAHVILRVWISQSETCKNRTKIFATDHGHKMIKFVEQPFLDHKLIDL